MIVRLAFRPRLQDGDGPMADEIIELLQYAADDALTFLPRRSLGKDRLEHAGKEKGLEEAGFA